MVGLTIFFISFRKNHRQKASSLLDGARVSLCFILTAFLSALIVGYDLPFHFGRGSTGRHFLELFLIAIICEALVYSIIYMIEYAITSRRNAEREKDRADLAKFQYLNLKQQVNPHFLFNSLNILDALVLDGKDQEASTYIHKLAGLYRYMLKNEDETIVSLRDEMTYVEMYSDLLKVRFQEGFNLQADIREEDMARFVIPCSVQLLIENATKHNAVSPERPLNVSVTSDGSSITVTNNLIPRVTKSQSSGLGLNYIREQYKERSGKGIVIEQTDESYTVKLPLL
ncbi:MAG: sensor histidine kinase [Bacteroidales bacterium]|nr:sensor histidine kinase [Bacteroidales bacterium]